MATLVLLDSLSQASYNHGLCTKKDGKMQRMIQQSEGITATIAVPGSKSITHRALLLAALADGVSEISGMATDKSICAFIESLRQLGIVIQFDQEAKSCIIAGCNGKFPKKQNTVWCDASPTLVRFLLAACAGTPGVYYFDGDMTLRQKTFVKLLSILSLQGVQFTPSDATHLPLTLIGADSLEGGEIVLHSTIQSQLLSALLIVSPYARSPFIFTFPKGIPDETLAVTSSIMAEFGVLIHHVHQGQLTIPVPQRYQAKDYVVEPDFSLAAYFFAAAALTQGEITIQPLKRFLSKQVNSRFLTILEQMGCLVLEKHTGLTLKGPDKLRGVQVNLPVFSDLFLALAAIAPFAATPTKITHEGVLSHKELKRLKCMKVELTKLGLRVEAGKDWLEIFPAPLHPGLVNTHHDHHIAMAFLLLRLKAPQVTLDSVESIQKAHPEFFALWNKVTGHMQINEII